MSNPLGITNSCRALRDSSIRQPRAAEPAPRSVAAWPLAGARRDAVFLETCRRRRRLQSRCMCTPSSVDLLPSACAWAGPAAVRGARRDLLPAQFPRLALQPLLPRRRDQDPAKARAGRTSRHAPPIRLTLCCAAVDVQYQSWWSMRCPEQRQCSEREGGESKRGGERAKGGILRCRADWDSALCLPQAAGQYWACLHGLGLRLPPNHAPFPSFGHRTLTNKTRAGHHSAWL